MPPECLLRNMNTRGQYLWTCKLPKISRLHVQRVDVQVRDVGVPTLRDRYGFARVRLPGMGRLVAAAGRQWKASFWPDAVE